MRRDIVTVLEDFIRLISAYPPRIQQFFPDMNHIRDDRTTWITGDVTQEEKLGRKKEFLCWWKSGIFLIKKCLLRLLKRKYIFWYASGKKRASGIVHRKKHYIIIIYTPKIFFWEHATNSTKIATWIKLFFSWEN